MALDLARSLLTLACAAAACAPASATNLLANGSFENPLTLGANNILPGGSTFITGWTTVFTGVEHFDALAYGGAADGRMAVDLANYTYTQGGLEQTVATTAGQTYLLNFASGNLRASGRDGTGVVRVAIDGQWLADVNTPAVSIGTTVWAQHSLQFVAGGPTTTVRFWNEQNAYQHFALIDAVALAPVPEPASAVLLLGGLALVAARRARR